jgi:fucose 4-O-acetylase-like acetyltransferase
VIAMPKNIDLISKNNRIEWIDVFKGIAIILVVIGHATGNYNAYIYQFHMAAFLFISGYTSNYKRERWIRFIVNKFKRLLLPLLTVTVLLLMIHVLLIQTDKYYFFFDDNMIYIGFLNTIKTFIRHGDNYVWELGAGWFVIVLFGVQIVSKLLRQLTQNLWIYITASYAISIVGYGLIELGQPMKVYFLDFSLIFIAHLYFAIGNTIRELKLLEKLSNNQHIQFVTLVSSTLLMIYVRYVLKVTVNYPSKQFNTIVTDTLVGLNGTLLLISLSMILSHFLFIQIKKLFVYIGQNTLSILFFHFIGFKFAYLILYLGHVVSIDYFRNLVPPAGTVNNAYWPLFVVISIGISILIWRCLCIIYPIRVLLGEEPNNFTRSNKFFNYILENSIYLVRSLITFVKRIFLKINKWYISIFGICFFILLPLRSAGVTNNTELQYRYWRFEGRLEILFQLLLQKKEQNSLFYCMQALNTAILYPTTNEVVNGFLRVLILSGAIALLSYFINMITKRYKESAFITICLAALLPSFFPAETPYTLTAYFALPLIYLLVATLLFIKWRKDKKICKLICSIVLVAMSVSSKWKLFNLFEIFNQETLNNIDSITLNNTLHNMTIIFIIALLGSHILNKYRSIRNILLVLLCICVSVIQWRSDQFIHSWSRNYQKFKTIEELFSTQTLESLRGEVAAPDLHQIGDGFIVDDGYWTNFAQDLRSLNILVSSKVEDEYSDQNIIHLDENTYLISSSVGDMVLTKEHQTGSYIAKYPNQSLYVLEYPEMNDQELLNNMDGEFNKYLVTKVPVESLGESMQFGLESDGWIGPQFLTRLKTGSEGRIILNAYFPNSTTGKETGTAWVDGKKYSYHMENEVFTLAFPAEKNKVVTLYMQNDFTVYSELDQRELCFIISSIVVE